MRVQAQLHRNAIHQTLRHAHEDLQRKSDARERSVAEARWQGLITGLLLTFPLPDVERFILEAIT